MKHKAIVITAGNFVLQPLTNDLKPYKEKIINDLYRLFSNSKILKFNNNRRIQSIDDAAERLDLVANSYIDETGYTYYILDNNTKELLGEILITSPKGFKSWYPFLATNKEIFNSININKTWLIEFYLLPKYWGKGLIPYFANGLMQELEAQGAKSVIAFCEHDNAQSIKTLLKLDFKRFENLRGDYGLWIKKFKNRGFWSLFK